MTCFLPTRRTTLAAALCALAGAAACTEGGGPPTEASPGSLAVVVNATGIDADDKFSIQVNGGDPLPYAVGTPFVREDLPASTYTVRISGIATNCTLQGGETVQATVFAGQRATVTFNVTCTPRWLVVAQFSFTGGGDLYRMDRTGANVVRLTTGPGTASSYQPAVSPDGRKIAFVSNRDGNPEIYVMNADGTNPVRLTNLPTLEWGPAWSPDGARIAFVAESPETGAAVIRVMNADGSGVADVPGGPLPIVPPVRWSPDGNRLALTLLDEGGDYNVYTMVVATGARTRVTTNPLTDIYPSWTADGRLVYTSVTEELTGVFAMNADGNANALLFDDRNQTEFRATLSSDGKWLAYDGTPAFSSASRVYVVSTTDGAVTLLTPTFFANGASWAP
ncbi:MAG TPA: LpqB family beta-propeller domain-containing protein [Longimicrobium sp.]|nr:LpqB family beta-propeller domain-containing protein [Longimicrobium sp.]